MKRLIGILLAISVFATSVICVGARDIVFFGNDTEVYVDGEYVKILESEGITPVIKDGVFYVPIRAFVELNNGKIAWKHSGNQVEANVILGGEYAVKSNSNEVVFSDGSTIEMDAEVFLNTNYNRLMVPADVFEKLGYAVAQVNDALGIRIEGKFSTQETVDASETTEGLIETVKAEYDFASENGNVKIAFDDDDHSDIGRTVGKIGSVINVNTVEGIPLQGQLTIEYNPALLNGASETDLKLARYNELEDKMEILKNVSVDTEAKTLSAPIGASGKYVLVDGAMWVDAWAKQQLLIREDGDNRLFNVAFVLDVSGSMSSGIELLKSATLNFISELYPEDYVSVTTFESSAKTVLTGKYVKNITEDDLDLIREIRATGGTNMYEGFNTASSNMYSLYGYENIMIVLSDGATNNKDMVINEAKEFGRADTRIISLALGSSSDVSLMERLAEETNGIYQYVDSPEDLQTVFEMMRGVSIGLETDTDGDGIPDLIETTGMRDQYGCSYTTNPQVADSDGDGYTDGEEMGVLISGDYAYFKRKSDPTVSSAFMNKAKAELNNINVNADYEDYGVAQVDFLLNYIHFENLVLSENIYEEPQNVKVLVDFGKEQCLELVHVEQDMLEGKETEKEIDITDGSLGSASGGSEYVKVCIKCNDNHDKKHDVTLKFSGDNFDSFELPVTIDYAKIKEYYESRVRSEYDEMLSRIKKEIDKKVKEGCENKTSVKDTQKEKISSLYSKYFVEPTGTDLSDDELFAVKKAVLNFADDEDYTLKLSDDEDDVVITKDVANWISLLFGDDKEEYSIKISNVTYNVKVSKSFNGFNATINDKEINCGVNANAAMNELENLQDDLEELAENAIDNVGEELLSLASDTIFTDSVMDEIDDMFMEAVEKVIPDLSEVLKFAKTIYKSTQGEPSYSTMKSQCDDILEQDFAPSTKEIVKKLVGKIEKIVD